MTLWQWSNNVLWKYLLLDLYKGVINSNELIMKRKERKGERKMLRTLHEVLFV